MEMGVYQDIIGGKPIEKGWSGDRKYCATTADGSKYLLRLSPLEKHDRRKREFDKMCEVAALSIPMAQPVEFGVCAEGFCQRPESILRITLEITDA